MKRLLILLCASSLLACTDGGTGKSATLPETKEAHQHNDTAKLALNNGSRWNSDRTTNNNVDSIKSIVDRFVKKQPNSRADFTGVTNELETALDKMIRECRMQGPDHEALHQWLAPLIKNVGQLKKATDENKASQLLGEINEQLNNYHQYFE